MRTYAEECWIVLRETAAHSKRVDLKIFAGSLAFTTVLSIIPVIAVIFWVVQSLGYLDMGYLKLQPIILQNLAPGSGASIDEHILDFLKKTRTSAVGFAGIAGLLVTAIMTFNQFTWVINKIMGVKNDKRWLRKAAKSTLFLIFAPPLLALSITLSALIPFKGLPVALFIDTAAFCLIYGVLPNKRIAIGATIKTSFIMAVTWEIAKILYTYYSKKAVSYSNFYGSFSVIPLFLIWIYIGWYIVLVGAALLRTMQEQAAIKRNAT